MRSTGLITAAVPANAHISVSSSLQRHRRTCTEELDELAPLGRLDDLLHRHGTLVHDELALGHAFQGRLAGSMVAREGEHGIPSDTGENHAIEGRRNQFRH